MSKGWDWVNGTPQKIRQDTSSNATWPDHGPFLTGSHELTTDGRCPDCEADVYINTLAVAKRVFDDTARERTDIQQLKDTVADKEARATITGILAGLPNEGSEADASDFFVGFASDPVPARATRFEADVYGVAGGCVELLLSKHKDYGPGNIAGAPGGPLNGLRVRMHDKVARINHLIDSGAPPEHESLRDSFVDLANYAMIALMVLDNTWPTDQSKE